MPGDESEDAADKDRLESEVGAADGVESSESERLAQPPTEPDFSNLFKEPDFSKLFGGPAFSKLVAGPAMSDIRKMTLGNIPDFRKMLGFESPLAKMVGVSDLGKVIFPDYAAIVPRYNFSQLAGLNLGAIQTPFDALKGVGTPNFTAGLLGLNVDRLIPKYDFRRIAEQLEEQWQAANPPNWPEDSFEYLDLVGDILNNEGIPLVWVPRSGIVKELLAADSREARVAILMARKDELITDCRATLAELSHSRLLGQQPLAASAMQSLADGHEQPAQALAVVVTETAVARALGDRYKDVKKQVKFDVEDVPFTAFRTKAAFAPIGSFYTNWWASTGDPLPTNLSRHVSVHNADSRHYTPENALLSVLLMASVLRAFEEYWSLEEPEQEP